MSAIPESVERIADGGRDELLTRLRSAVADELQRSGGGALDGEELERRVADAAGRAGPNLWRRSLAQAAIAQLGIDLASAIDHPDVRRAHELVGAPPYGPDGVAVDQSDGASADGSDGVTAAPVEAELEALRIPAVHISGIEALPAGERDIELRLSDAGLDILKRSTGAPVGRLDAKDISAAELLPPRRGLRAGRRRAHELHVQTGAGRASFELPGLTEEQLKEHLEPMLARTLADRG